MKIDRIHFYVEDIATVRNWFQNQMGLLSLRQWVKKNTITELMGINEVFFLISAPLNNASPVADYLKKYPSGVADVGLKVNNIKGLLTHLSALNIKVLEVELSSQKEIKRVKIQGWGSLTHTITQQEDLRRLPNNPNQPDFDINRIDHVVLNIESKDFEAAISWYQTLFNWRIQQKFEIQTNHSSLSSVALIDAQQNIQFNINKPTSSNSQIQEFLEINQGAGIQHIALHSNNIFKTVGEMREKGVQFLPIPHTYYRQLSQRYSNGNIPSLTDKEWRALEALEILLDWPENQRHSMLMQVFSQPIFEKPTFFFEIIERRKQVQGFGENNFQALFEAVEREQFIRHSF
ncbi:MAG: 4-hydroxyphenylpyruvate dioxygenase [Microcystaceae cyanobacterium]